MVMSDRIVLMNEGCIVQVGSPTELYNRPATEFASRFIGEANLLDGTIQAVEGDLTRVAVNGLLLVTLTRAGLSAGQPVIVSIRPERASLFARREEVPADWHNVFPGTVASAIFLGPIARYQLVLDTGQLFLVDQAAVGGTLSYHAGDQLCVGWETASNVVLAA